MYFPQEDLYIAQQAWKYTLPISTECSFAEETIDWRPWEKLVPYGVCLGEEPESVLDAELPSGLYYNDDGPTAAFTQMLSTSGLLAVIGEGSAQRTGPCLVATPTIELEYWGFMHKGYGTDSGLGPHQQCHEGKVVDQRGRAWKGKRTKVEEKLVDSNEVMAVTEWECCVPFEGLACKLYLHPLKTAAAFHSTVTWLRGIRDDVKVQHLEYNWEKSGYTDALSAAATARFIGTRTKETCLANKWCKNFHNDDDVMADIFADVMEVADGSAERRGSGSAESQRVVGEFEQWCQRYAASKGPDVQAQSAAFCAFLRREYRTSFAELAVSASRIFPGHGRRQALRECGTG
jgi:hypothetical protein